MYLGALVCPGQTSFSDRQALPALGLTQGAGASCPAGPLQAWAQPRLVPDTLSDLTFVSLGNCTWGMNCRFIHPGVNDKGNYSLITKAEPFPPNGAPPLGPHPLMPANPWVREHLCCCWQVGPWVGGQEASGLRKGRHHLLPWGRCRPQLAPGTVVGVHSPVCADVSLHAPLPSHLNRAGPQWRRSCRRPLPSPRRRAPGSEDCGTPRR